MRFNVVRQPLIPAFLSLVILLFVALSHTTNATVVSDPLCGFTPEELPIAPLRSLINQFAATHNGWAHTIGGFLILFSALTIGRMSARLKLYGISTFLAMPLYMVALMGLMPSPAWFFGIVTSTLLTLMVKNCCYSFRNGFSFDNVFRAAMYLALLFLVEPKAAPLFLLLPIALVQFRRATRESMVAIGGLLLPPFALCYLNWGAGGSFTAPTVALYRQFMAGEWLSGILHADMGEAVVFGVFVVLNLLAVLLFYANSYALSTRSRHTLLFASYLLLFTISIACMPAADRSLIGLLAVPSALLLPVLFIRIRKGLAQILYPALIVAAIVWLIIGL